MEGQRDCKPPKTTDGIIAPMINMANRRRHSSIFDPYATDTSNCSPPLMTYLRSSDPGASTDSPPVFITPVKVEEEVIVMDGIPVPKSNRVGGEPRLSFPSMSSNSIASGRSNLNSSLSTGSGSRVGVTDNSKSHKNKLCRFWESIGTCQFGTECQFAHGKEELRPPRSSGKPKFEIFKLPNNSEGINSLSYGTKYTSISQAKAEEEEAMSLPPGVAFLKPVFPVEQVPGRNNPSKSTTNSTVPRSDWSPEDDGIDVKLPKGSKEEKNPSKEEVDACIERVLYERNTSRKQLAVFREICRD